MARGDYWKHWTVRLEEGGKLINIVHLRELPNHLNLRRAYPRGDAKTEHQRAIWRKADAKRRGNYKYVEEGV